MRKQAGRTAPVAKGAAVSDRRKLNRIETLLIKRGVVSSEALAAARDRQRGAHRPLVEVLLEQEALEESLLVDVLAEATGMEVIDESALRPDPSVQDLVPANVAQRLGLLPLRLEGKVLVVATGDPLQVLAFDELARRTGLRVRPLFAKPTAVRQAMREARGGEEVLHDVVKNALPADDLVIVEREAAEGGPGALRLEADEDDGPTIKMVNLILSDAINRQASDVHIEVEKATLRVRFRIDGELQDILSLPANAAAPILSRIKIISGLDTLETRRPQDGRTKVACRGREYDLRVSTLPAYFGEKAVLRILDGQAPILVLSEAGFEPGVCATWSELIHRPNGLVLLTGPTGSGKTSTLYASLLEVRSPQLNIVTVEDPVEYQFSGIVHVPVRHEIGMTFAACLRSILRQDPDVVLVGEIRDRETAQIAIQASLTGHLVLSTLHTNDAFGALPRLLDLGIEMDRITACLCGVMAQRLVRTICPDCAAPHSYERQTWASLDVDPSRADTSRTRRGSGCRSCGGTGLRGRTAIAELLVMTPGLVQLLKSGADDEALRTQARRDGSHPLIEAGASNVLKGVCTPEEILRVAAPEPVPERAGAPAPSHEAVGCPSCGEALQPHWRLCPMCGASLDLEQAGDSVLVCDDDRLARRQATHALRGAFPIVREAEDGESALDMIARRRPDLLIVDMMMPGLSGIEVIQALRSNLDTAALPIIMLTSDTELEERSLHAGADDYLCKPIEPERLRMRACALVESRRRLAAQT